MPYKNPECKSKWESEHRDRRNTNRRKQRSANQLDKKSDTIRPNPPTAEDPTSYWKTIGGIAVGVGLVALTVFLGLSGLGDLDPINSVRGVAVFPGQRAHRFRANKCHYAASSCE
jgi:hypothetical protein